MATIKSTTYNNASWMSANGIRALQRPDGLWQVEVIGSLHMIARAATTEQARQILEG